MLSEVIKNFPSQFDFKPRLENAAKLIHAETTVVAGMGGSHLAADLLKAWRPELDLTIHSDYGLPPFSEEKFKKTLIIASSFSGNTEETIDAFRQAREKDLPTAVVANGGKLLELAKAERVPFIQFPDPTIQPRSALGYSIVALLTLMQEQNGLVEVKAAAGQLDPAAAEDRGKKLAEKLKGFIPVIYSSAKNGPVALNWKIRFNENGKVPAFHNVFPELNHNEINGFEAVAPTKNLLERFYFIFLKDGADHPRVKIRMGALEKIYREMGLPVEVCEFQGESVWVKILSSLLLAEWASFYLATNYGLDPEAIEFIEKFKKLIG